jgi:hypothetical protein
MVDLESLTGRVREIFKSFLDNDIADKVKRDITNIPEEIDEVIGNTKETIEDPTGKLLSPIKEAGGDLLSFVVIGFIYFLVVSTILFSLFQIFKSNPKPLSSITKGSKKVISKGKKAIRRNKK